MTSKKRLFTAKVISNKIIRSGFCKLRFEFDPVGGQAFGGVMPGQFAEIQLSQTALPNEKQIPEELADRAARQILLRRPFSFSQVDTLNETIYAEILYCVLGPGTLRMTTLAPGDTVSVIGPLGNGFSVPHGKKTAILVAGGMGAPPLQHLAEFLHSHHKDITPVVFVGAKSIDTLPFELRIDNKRGVRLDEFEKLGIDCHISSDDGSIGSKGFVTENMRKWLSGTSIAAEETMIYACGPEPMLAETAKLALETGIDCQVSMERMMACGIGLCQSCAVKSKESGQNKQIYKLCCKDGPVFNAAEVVFET